MQNELNRASADAAAGNKQLSAWQVECAKFETQCRTVADRNAQLEERNQQLGKNVADMYAELQTAAASKQNTLVARQQLLDTHEAERQRLHDSINEMKAAEAKTIGAMDDQSAALKAIRTTLDAERARAAKLQAQAKGLELGGRGRVGRRVALNGSTGKGWWNRGWCKGIGADMNHKTWQCHNSSWIGGLWYGWMR